MIEKIERMITELKNFTHEEQEDFLMEYKKSFCTFCSDELDEGEQCYCMADE